MAKLQIRPLARVVEDEVLVLEVHLVVDVLVEHHRRLCRLHVVVIVHLDEEVDHVEDVQHEELVLEGISPPY